MTLTEEIAIVYEDENFFVLNKPAGISVQKPEHSYTNEQSLIDLLLKKYPRLKSVGENLSHPALIHRLDKETSGLLIAAKNNETYHYFKRLFLQHEIEKTYIGLVYGTGFKKKGTINFDLIRKGPYIAVRRTQEKKHKKIRKATTHYEIIKEWRNFSLVEIKPRTGRMHQIRVHFAALGHPIVGDKKYARHMFSPPFALDRHFLHASKLAFKTPGDKNLILEAGLPDELRHVIQWLDKNDKS